MRRNRIAPRDGWQATVEAQGMLYHSTDEGVYWDESAYYELTSNEVDALETATKELHAMCLEMGQKIIDRDLFSKMNIPPQSADLIRDTWESEPPAIYGRFDFAFNGQDIKLLEYNADTPTSLLEAAVIQWYWLQDVKPGCDQFNSIHERLVAKWKELKAYVGPQVHFASLENYEDIMTNTYMMETARQGGIKVTDLAIREIGHDAATGQFVGMKDERISTLFKLYPWENLMLDEFGKFIRNSGMNIMEPAWKMMFSNKAIMALLWEEYPTNKYLLPTYFDDTRLKFSAKGMWVRKPFISREGANVQILDRSKVAEETDGPYSGPYIYQEMADLKCYQEMYPIIGSWVIDGESAGIGIRESSNRITGNTSRFVPHLFY